MNLVPIAHCVSDFDFKFGTPRQSGLINEARATLIFEPWVQLPLASQGLSEFSHIWLIFGFHKNDSQKSNSYHAKVFPPRLNGESLGFLATRSPHRPNPLGLSLVYLERIEADRILVSGADLISGTPIYDIKPYLPNIEGPLKRDLQSARQPRWTKDAHANHQDFKITWTGEALIQLETIVGKDVGDKVGKDVGEIVGDSEQLRLKTIVESSLKLDPRPKAYKSASAKKMEHVIRLRGIDFFFSYSIESEVIITRVIDCR
jgi:tRNA (adenine37-N6)-methyltransferase